MQDTDYLEIKKKIISGVFALTSRTLVLQIIAFVSTFILTILLSPSIFGVFFMVSAFISFLGYFSDIGLAAALIQKKEEPTQDELKTVFTIQQLLVITFMIIGLFCASYIGNFYNFGQDGTFLFRALLISFFLSSLKTIPSVIIERRLEFSRLIVPQILETAFFYLVTIILAYYHFGVVSFAWGAIVRGIVGLVAIYIICPWRISIGISRPVAKHLLKFGIPFQANSFLALVKDDAMTIFLGKLLPFAQIGYIGWAKKWAEAPLRLIMDSIIRVTFPAYSRLQEDKKILGRALEKSIFFLSLCIFPVSVFMVFLINPLIHIIPKYSKWEPAVLSFYIFVFCSMMAAFSSPLVNALNALGKIKLTLNLMILWTALTWIITPLLAYYIGFNGVAISALIISFTSFLPAVIMRKYVDFKFFTPMFRPFISTIASGIICFSIPKLFGENQISVFGSVITGVIIYLLFVYFWMRKEILPFLHIKT